MMHDLLFEKVWMWRTDRLQFSSFYSFISASPMGTSWTKELVAGPARYWPLRDIPKLRICHIVAKKHPEVIVGMQNTIVVDHHSDGEEDAGIG